MGLEILSELHLEMFVEVQFQDSNNGPRDDMCGNIRICWKYINPKNSPVNKLNDQSPCHTTEWQDTVCAAHTFFYCKDGTFGFRIVFIARDNIHVGLQFSKTGSDWLKFSVYEYLRVAKYTFAYMTF